MRRQNSQPHHALIGEIGSPAFHPFSGHSVVVATMHGKEQILGPLLNEIGLQFRAASIDTDLFGTFSGEIERHGSVRETLRQKIRAASAKDHEARFFLASEGSFGPHPRIGFIPSDLESLLFWDRSSNLEIYAEHLALSPMNGERTLSPRDDYRKAFAELGFPLHGLVIRPEIPKLPIFKGLQSEIEAIRAMLTCFANSESGRVVIANDLRAHYNPTRQLAIAEAGKSLIEKLRSFCPQCAYPGYSIVRGVPGLPCEACGEPSHAARAVVWECVACKLSEEKPTPDAKTSIDSSECEFCNP